MTDKPVTDQQNREQYEYLSQASDVYYKHNKGTRWVSVFSWLVGHRKINNALDIGCGNNLLTKVLLDHSIDAVGCDWMRPEHHPKLLLPERYHCHDAENLPAEWTDKFDLVCSFHFLEHAKDKDTAWKMLQEHKRCARMLVVCEISLGYNFVHTCQLQKEEWQEMWDKLFTPPWMASSMSAYGYTVPPEGSILLGAAVW